MTGCLPGPQHALSNTRESYPVPVHRPTPELHNSAQVFCYLEGFRKERRLLLGLFFIAALAPAYFAADFSNLMPSTLLRLVPAIGVALAAASVLAVIELYRSMARKLIKLHGTYSMIDRQNRIDPLTGALSRSCFLDAYEEALARHRKRGSVALVVIDIDHFKQLNDGFGHPAGDQVLEFCARAAKDAFHQATVGRLGGDEFAVFFSHEEEISEAYIEQACETLLATLRDGVYLNSRRQPLSASMGIAVSPRDDTNMRVLMSHADMALYQTKRNGRAGWSFFRKDILGDMRHERFVERELRAAILMQQLSVVYQPIVDGDGQLNSLEALVRWDNPVRGTISPAEFIPVAEKSNMIHDLGVFVLSRVCRDLPELPDVPVNVNVSARQLRLAEFKRDYLDVLEKHGVEARNIILEITESSLLETSEKFVKRIDDLRAAGFRIALDDFGLGYSEFNQLRTLPFDIIKIDKSFIQNIGLDRVTDVFVSAVVQIADHLDRSVVAEGIESEADGVRAAVAGCRLFQGYHYNRPVSREELALTYGRRPIRAVA
jgi:diguanylate cyclase (GGDEF)-like protein